MDEKKESLQESRKPTSSEENLRIDLSEALESEAEDDDEIIDLKDEVKIAPREKEDEIELMDKDDTVLADEKEIESNYKATEESKDDDEIIKPADRPAIDDADDKVIFKLGDETDLETQENDDVIEITEFDEILSEETKATTNLTADEDDIGSGDEEFLELIDVEDDSSTTAAAEEEEGYDDYDDEIIQFNEAKAEMEDVELEDFINESLSEEINIAEDMEEDFADSLGIESGSEINMSEEITETEEFDFNIDTKEISEKIDQLDTILFEESSSEIEPETAQENALTTDDYLRKDSPQHILPSDLTPDQFDESIERVIQQNFSDKIEAIIVQVIEKAVSKEINRLKSILLDDTTDNEDLKH